MGECWNCGATADDDWSCQGCRTERALAQDLADAGREIERLRAKNERLQALWLNLWSIASDRRYSNEFVGQLTRSRLDALLAAATPKGGDREWRPVL